MTLSRLGPLGRLAALGAALAAALVALPNASANHGDVHAYCNGNTPVVTQRPPGMENVTVSCEDGVPAFVVQLPPVPTYDPVKQDIPRQTPPDFGGWVTVWLNGRPLKTPYDPIRGVWEPTPYLANSTGRVMMPVRFFTEAFGGQVTWDKEEGRAQLLLQGKSIQLWLDQNAGLVGSKIVPLDQKPITFLDRMFVPVRFLAENFGGQVEWDHSGRSAKITMQGLKCSNPVYCGELR
jgi:hypothetical protein